ncbi:deoxyribonuclease IV [Candidatus Bathyarchaeota archaeon]|nr:deoxyribonuclease IV [Candidatus Bathyarchaeota archaeon]
MLKIGFHVSIIGRIDEAVDRAVEIGCNTFQIFTRNPRSWKAENLKREEVKAFIEKVERFDMQPVFAHMPYLANLASPRPNIYFLSVKTLKMELERCRILKIPYLVTHLGSHLGSGKSEGFKRIIKAINEAYSSVGGEVTLLLENTAGTKNSMGSSFEDIKYIIDNLKFPDFVGVCFDTAHAYAAGYDLRTQRAVQDVIRRFDEIIGFEKLRLVHLNDSRGGLGSHIDRHEHIGMGKIGEEGFRAILKSKLGRLPLIMETPIDERRSDVENLLKVLELAGLK